MYGMYNLHSTFNTVNCVIFVQLLLTSIINNFHYSTSVCPCYPDECGSLPIDLLQLLENQAAVLHPDVRLGLLVR